MPRYVWTAVPTNLPLQLTSFIGRERQLDEIREILANSRMLTLTGTGGVGKSRLALELAARLLNDYPDGVWWAELAPLSDPAAVPRAVAAAFEMREQPGESLIESVRQYLHDRRVLLVLDNCEHLLSACVELTDDLLRTCPSLRLLATSREALNNAGERIWLTPSMALGTAAGTSEAAELFIARARDGNAGFAVEGSGNRRYPRIETICRQLDGIPLAIELAATLTNVLSLDQIAARLNQRYELLTGGRSTALPRHRTLRALVDWSHEQLSEPERVLFRRLAVFVGGWRLEAAEVICADEVIASADVLPILARLVARSLVVVEHGDSVVRYSMLETLREYAVEKLDESAEEPALRQRQLAWLVREVEEVARSGPWSTDLDPEQENITVALRWAREHPTVLAEGVRLCFSAVWSWNATGQLGEALETTRLLVDSARAAQPNYPLSAEMWTALLATAGFVAILAGQVAQGQALLAFDRGDHARAEGQSEKGLTLAGATLGPVAAHAARLAGRQMNRAQATACALSPDDSLRVAPVGDASLLTVREREVAALVGRGLSNREIAQVLVITTGTAGLHVQHIFDKLGVHNRTLLAAWALAQELSSTPRTLRPAPDIPRVRNKLGNCSS